MINVLVADDSSFMRLAIDKMLSRDPEFNIVGFCTNGQEVLEKVKELKPDVLTLDIEMPKMNGLEALEKVMESNPLPVIMVSSLTVEGAEETLKALELGAVDFIAKPSSFVSLKITDIYEELASKIKVASKANLSIRLRHAKSRFKFVNRISDSLPPVTNKVIDTTKSEEKFNFISKVDKTSNQKPPEEILLEKLKEVKKTEMFNENSPVSVLEKKREEKENRLKFFRPELIIIGISTGGPVSLQKVIPKLPKDLPCGIIIAQHMPPGFTNSLANRLNYVSPIDVKEAENGDIIRAGRVLVAPSGFQTEIAKRFIGYSVHITDEGFRYLYKPCIDVIFSSAAKMYRDKVLGIIMTGMGNDGTAGAKEIKANGGKIFAESEETCLISSMPKSAVKAGAVDLIYPLEKIADAIIALYE